MKNKKNQKGFIVSIELITLATICVIGLIVGMTDVRDAVLAELSDISESIGALDQSYEIFGVQNSAQTAYTSGSQWQDLADNTQSGNHIDQNANGANVGDAGQSSDITFQTPPTNESTVNPTLVP